MFRLASMIDVDEGFYQAPTLSTAGAVTVKDEKGRLVTKKVKVHRYVAGKRPDYAGHSEDGGSDNEYEDRSEDVKPTEDLVIEQPLSEDRRLRRMLDRDVCEENDERIRRHCHERCKDSYGEMFKPLTETLDDYLEEDVKMYDDFSHARGLESQSEDEEYISNRRAMLRARLIKTQDSIEFLERDDVDERSDREMGDADQYTTDEEEEPSSDSDSEHVGKPRNAPRLKPIFVRRQDRATIADREAENKARIEKEEREARTKAEERRRQTLKMLEEEIRRDDLKQKKAQDESAMFANLANIDTDDEENDVVEYERWKLRELKRLKRQQEQMLEKEKERQEAERNRLLADAGRLEELRNKQRFVVNQEIKGKYKFLQKYYHRGAFYLDKTDNVFTRDFSAPTLEDHFDKTILPRIMQVKNFGMAGRTKYTHLVDQDTTCFESPWAMDKVQLLRFHNAKGGGMKQCFDNPSTSKRKT